MQLNEFGEKCFSLHYLAHDLYDIENFIEEVVMKENDFRKDERLEFINKELIQWQDKSVAQKIYEEITKEFDTK